MSEKSTEQAWTEALAKAQPKQIPEGARLMKLTAELRAHYACDPALNCGHPDCQPTNPEETR